MNLSKAFFMKLALMSLLSIAAADSVRAADSRLLYLTKTNGKSYQALSLVTQKKPSEYRSEDFYSNQYVLVPVRGALQSSLSVDGRSLNLLVPAPGLYSSAISEDLSKNIIEGKRLLDLAQFSSRVSMSISESFLKTLTDLIQEDPEAEVFITEFGANLVPQIRSAPIAKLGLERLKAIVEKNSASCFSYAKPFLLSIKHSAGFSFNSVQLVGERPLEMRISDVIINKKPMVYSIALSRTGDTRLKTFMQPDVFYKSLDFIDQNIIPDLLNQASVKMLAQSVPENIWRKDLIAKVFANYFESTDGEELLQSYQVRVKNTPEATVNLSYFGDTAETLAIQFEITQLRTE